MNKIYDKITGIDLAIVAVYLIALLVIGYLASFSARKKNETLFLANKSLNWYNIGFNMWGTNVGPSSLLTFAMIGFTTGITGANVELYAFLFLLLLTMVFAPRYIASKVATMPEYMGKLFGDSTQNILAWYALVKILVSWLSLGLFSGGVLVRQILGIPMWQSAIVLVAFSGLFTFAGGLKAIARVNVFQMLLLITVSIIISVVGLQHVGGFSELMAKTPAGYWELIKPASDPDFPWPAVLLGYPVAAVAFFCTDQAMVQSVLGAKNLQQGQLGVNLIGWLKVLALPLFILPGILCFVLFPTAQPDEAYMTMVTQLLPTGVIGLVICVLIAVLVATIGSSLNALSTVFTNDIYVKKMNPEASVKKQIQVGRIVVVAGCVIAVLMAIALDNVKGQSLFYIFQSILGFLAPSLSVVFLLAVFWKRLTRLAVNFTLSWGSVFSLTVGLIYLWILPKDGNPYFTWPHPFMISFYIFAILFVLAIIISLLGKVPEPKTIDAEAIPPTSNKVKWLFGLLGVVILIIYFIF
ncbi:sodium:solute symporter family transporter [Niabella sp. 22666]|uniref:sodium:solute symporter family transporter n=1 Tax=Niabella sp. 22666 TaxID=3453954 RepID=UPI003F84352B